MPFKKGYKPWNKGLNSKIDARVRNGFNHSEETKSKISNAKTGIKLSEEHKKKIGKSNIGKNIGRKISEETRNKISLACRGQKLSKETKNKMSESRMGKKNHFYGKKHSEDFKRKVSGENHWKWNPDLTDKDRYDKRKYLRYVEWRKAIYERDNYTCKACNERGGVVLNAHHLESYKDNMKLRTKLYNGITLCLKCHNDFHHQHGYRCTEKQFKEFIGDKRGLVPGI